MLRELLSASCSALLSWQGCSRISELRGSIDGRERLRFLTERFQSSLEVVEDIADAGEPQSAAEVLEDIAAATKRLEPCNCMS